MKKITLFAGSAIVAFLAGWNCNTANIELSNELAIYKEYHDATEEFLDTLENDCNWVDRYDPESYYQAIYKIYNLSNNK